MSDPRRLSRTSTVLAFLRVDRWVEAPGPRTPHVQFVHPTKPGRISLDLSEPEIPTATLQSIYRRANWDW